MTTANAAGPETVLRLGGITKRFGALTANDAISLTLAKGEIVGLLGENGAGKTTLMNILFGHYVADEGTIEVEGKPLEPGSPGAALAAGIGMVHQHFTLADNLTVLDNIALGTESLWSFASDRKASRARIRELGESFGLAVDPDAVVSALSVGERQRVEILKALYRRARILILDEPTAVLTPQESDSLFATLKKFVAQGLSIIFISHKLNEVLAACSRICVLRAGKLVAERQARSVTKSDLAELMVGRAIPQARTEPQPPGPAVLTLKNISAQRGSQSLASVSLALHAGEITGIAGVSGNGQSLLADIVSGVAVATDGELRLGKHDRLACFAARHGGGGRGAHSGRPPRRRPGRRHERHRERDLRSLSLARASAARASSTGRRRGLSPNRSSADYDVKCPSPEARVRLLSGGNMQKLILGRVMANEPVVIMANQPTRGLDVGAVNYVHERLIAARQARRRHPADIRRPR